MAKTNKRIGLLFFNEASNKANQYELERFSQAAQKNGYKPELLPYYLFSVFYQKNKLEIYFNNKKFNPNKYVCIIARYNLTKNNLYHNFSVARYLELKGVKVFNSPRAAFLAKNKRDSLLKLALHNLPIIPTGINYSTFYLDPHLKKNFNKKIVVKSNNGSLGYQVALLESAISFISFMEFVGSTVEPANLLIQPYIHANSQDCRLIVVNNKVVAAMRRQANGIEFRSNISKGGRGTKIKPGPKMINLAIKAAKLLNLDFAGVDIIKQGNKLMLVEVNANPGLKIEQITGADVVGQIIKSCLKKAKKK